MRTFSAVSFCMIISTTINQSQIEEVFYKKQLTKRKVLLSRDISDNDRLLLINIL
jgi:hypothetical protein